jgi:hypothetical protein
MHHFYAAAGQAECEVVQGAVAGPVLDGFEGSSWGVSLVYGVGMGVYSAYSAMLLVSWLGRGACCGSRGFEIGRGSRAVFDPRSSLKTVIWW